MLPHRDISCGVPQGSVLALAVVVVVVVVHNQCINHLIHSPMIQMYSYTCITGKTVDTVIKSK